MILASSVDWNGILLAVITGIFTLLNTAILAFRFWFDRPPSGGRLGRMVEQTHANTGVTTAAVVGLDEDTNGKTTHPPLYDAKGG